MAEITFDEQQKVLKIIMEMKYSLQGDRLPNAVLIERATESIDILNRIFDEGDDQWQQFQKYGEQKQLR